MGLVMLVLGCRELEVAAAGEDLQVRGAGAWLDLSGAELELEGFPAALHVRNLSRIGQTVVLSMLSGQCDVPSEVELDPGESQELLVRCQQFETASEFRARITGGSRVGHVTGQVPAPAALQDVGLSSTCRFNFPPTDGGFERTEVGRSSTRNLIVWLDEGVGCRVRASLSEGSVFSLAPFGADGGTEILTAALDAPFGFPFSVEFTPDALDQDYSDTLRIELLDGQSGARTVALSGSSTSRCPALDAGCPTAGRGTYLSTADSLFWIDAGSPERIGSFQDVTGKPVFVHDLAVLPDGTLLAIGGSIYVVDAATATVRALFQPTNSYSGMEALPDGRVLLGGDGVVAVELDGGGLEQILPRGNTVSGDLAFGSWAEVYVSLGSFGSGADSIGVINLTTRSMQIVGPTAFGTIWGLTFDQTLVGYTNDGLLLEMPVDGSATGATPFPGTWTGAALAR